MKGDLPTLASARNLIVLTQNLDLSKLTIHDSVCMLPPCLIMPPSLNLNPSWQVWTMKDNIRLSTILLCSLSLPGSFLIHISCWHWPLSWATRSLTISNTSPPPPTRTAIILLSSFPPLSSLLLFFYIIIKSKLKALKHSRVIDVKTRTLLKSWCVRITLFFLNFAILFSDRWLVYMDSWNQDDTWMILIFMNNCIKGCYDWLHFKQLGLWVMRNVFKGV